MNSISKMTDTSQKDRIHKIQQSSLKQTRCYLNTDFIFLRGLYFDISNHHHQPKQVGGWKKI